MIESRFIVMINHDIESHYTNDLWSSEMMQLRKLCGAKAMIPQFFLPNESECLDTSIMYNSSISFY